MSSRKELIKKLKEYENHTYKDTIAYKKRIHEIKAMDDGSAKQEAIKDLKENLIPLLTLSINTFRTSLKNSLRSKSKSKSVSASESVVNMDVDNPVIESSPINISKRSRETSPVENSTRKRGGSKKNTLKILNKKYLKFCKLFGVKNT